MSPLAGGLLVGAAAEAAGGRRGGERVVLGQSARERRIADNLARLQQYEDPANELGGTCTTLALAWLLSRPGVTAPVIGPRTLEQLDGSLPTLDVALDGDVLARLDDIFPRPGGEARRVHLGMTARARRTSRLRRPLRGVR